jgi:hypothetical protein
MLPIGLVLLLGNVADGASGDAQCVARMNILYSGLWWITHAAAGPLHATRIAAVQWRCNHTFFLSADGGAADAVKADEDLA